MKLEKRIRKNNDLLDANGYFGEKSYSALKKFFADPDLHFAYFGTQSSALLMELAENLANSPIDSGFELGPLKPEPMPFMHGNIANIGNLDDPFYSMRVLRDYPYLVCTEPGKLSYTNKRVAEVINHDTKLFGYVNLGPNNPDKDKSEWVMANLADVKAEIDNIANAGWYGAYIDQFGFDWDTRVITDTETNTEDTIQNSVIQYAHQQGLSCFVNAWDPEDILNANDVDNPLQGKASLLGTNPNIQDWYLVESFFTTNGGYFGGNYKGYDFISKYINMNNEIAGFHQKNVKNCALSYKRDAETWPETNDDDAVADVVEDASMSYILSQCLGYDGWWYTDDLTDDYFPHGNDPGINIGTVIQYLHHDSDNKYVAETENYEIEYFAADAGADFAADAADVAAAAEAAAITAAAASAADPNNLELAEAAANAADVAATAAAKATAAAEGVPAADIAIHEHPKMVLTPKEANGLTLTYYTKTLTP